MESITLVTRIRRTALVAGFAVTLIAGSVAVGRPTGVSAAPMTCSQAWTMYRFYFAVGDTFAALENPKQATYYYGLAAGAVVDAC